MENDDAALRAQLAAKVGALGINATGRHIFLCCDQSKPKCSTREASLESWEYLRRRLRELGLAAGGGVYRTKANCLQVCMAGPVALVYPDGICRSRGWLEKDVGQYDVADEVLGPNGCAAAYRRAMLDDVGLFDERYFAYLEDLDLAFRGQLRGWRCRYVPDAICYHKKSITSGYHSAFKAFLVERNRIWNAIKLFPLRLLLLSPFYTLARYMAQGFATASGKGISSSFVRDYSRLELAGILLRAYVSAFASLPAMWRERKKIQRNRRLGALAVFMLMKKYRLPALELAFKD